MRRYVLLIAGCFAIPAFVLANEPVASASVITDLVATSKTATGQDIIVPTTPEIRTTIYTLTPGKRLPTHKHPHQRLGYIVEGAVDLVDTQAETITTYKAGSFLVEMRDEWHYGINNGATKATLLIIDIVPQDTQSNVVLENGQPAPPPPSPPQIFTTTMTGEPIQFIERPEIRSLVYEARPKEIFPPHKHPYPRMLHVLTGEIDIIDSESHEIRKLRKGDSLIEAVDRWHYGENNGAEPLKVLVIDFVPPGTGNNVTFKDSLH